MSTFSTPSPGQERLRDLWRMVTLNRKVAVGLGIVVFFWLIAIFGPFFYHNNEALAFSDAQMVPPSAAHWLGTTWQGQDIFAQVIVGSRDSLVLGFVTGIITTIISVIVGLVSGYFGGWMDELLSLFSNIFLLLPFLPLAIMLAAFIPYKGPLTIGFVTVLVGWSWGARVLRAQTLSMRHRDVVEASRATGESHLRIIFAEIMPNQIALIAVQLLSTIIFAILAETGLEYLGLGDVNTISWGNMFYWAANSDAMVQGAWLWFLVPGLCIALLGTGLVLINFGIDEIANPRLRAEKEVKVKTAGVGAGEGLRPPAALNGSSFDGQGIEVSAGKDLARSHPQNSDYLS
jgi:peptide/nickel transport system permease protein